MRIGLEDFLKVADSLGLEFLEPNIKINPILNM